MIRECRMRALSIRAEVTAAAERNPVRDILADETGAPDPIVWLDELPDGVRLTSNPRDDVILPLRPQRPTPAPDPGHVLRDWIEPQSWSLDGPEPRLLASGPRTADGIQHTPPPDSMIRALRRGRRNAGSGRTSICRHLVTEVAVPKLDRATAEVSTATALRPAGRGQQGRSQRTGARPRLAVGRRGSTGHRRASPPDQRPARRTRHLAGPVSHAQPGHPRTSGHRTHDLRIAGSRIQPRPVPGDPSADRAAARARGSRPHLVSTSERGRTRLPATVGGAGSGSTATGANRYPRPSGSGPPACPGPGGTPDPDGAGCCRNRRLRRGQRDSWRPCWSTGSRRARSSNSTRRWSTSNRRSSTCSTSPRP